jgi:hypothetical protein
VYWGHAGKTAAGTSGPPSTRWQPSLRAKVGEGVGMQGFNDGLATSRAPEVRWRKSRYSNPCGSCVEMARLGDGAVAVRNSRNPGGPVLVYSWAGMAAFIRSVRAGELDGAAGGPPIKACAPPHSTDEPPQEHRGR